MGAIEPHAHASRSLQRLIAASAIVACGALAWRGVRRHRVDYLTRPSIQQLGKSVSPQSPPDPELARAVDRLAGFDHVGYQEVPIRDDVWSAYRDVRAHARVEDIVALLKHPSPVVRAHMMKHVMDDLDVDPWVIYPLALDRSPISVVGSGRDDWTVGDFTVYRLGISLYRCDAHLDMLEAVALDQRATDRARGLAVVFTARQGRTRVYDTARALLTSSDPMAVRDALSALADFVTSADVPRVLDLARSADEDVRSQAIRVLVYERSTAGRDALASLLADRAAPNRAEVAAAYAYRCDADPRLLRDLVRERDGRIASEMVVQLELIDTDAARGVMMEALMRSRATMPYDFWQPDYPDVEAREVPLRAIARRLLRSASASVRRSARAYSDDRDPWDNPTVNHVRPSPRPWGVPSCAYPLVQP